MNLFKIKSNAIDKTILILVFSLFLGILFDYFFYDKVPGIAFPIYIILIILNLFTISRIFKKQISKQALWLLIPLIFFSTRVFIHTSSLLTFLNMVISLFLLLLLIKILYGETIRSFLANDYIKTMFLPFRFISPLFQTISNLFSSQNTNNKNQKVLPQVLKGFAMAIPVLLIFILLFSSADLIFKRYISDLITFNIQTETLFRFVLILIVTLVFVGVNSYISQDSKDKITPVQKKKIYLLGNIESSIILGLVNILFLLFIVIQLTYLFGGKNNISAQGLTYAEYARQGFFELIIVAVISLFLLLTIEKYVAKKDEIHMLWFKMLSTTMIVQVILIMVSAFTRLQLYEEAYGFTTLRLYSHAFIFLLAVIFCLLIYKIHCDTRENIFTLRVFILVLLFLVGMNFLNPDLYIAKQNLERFTTTGKLDVYYLTNLSDDAIPEIVKALDTTDGDMKNSLGYELYWRTQNKVNFERWQSFNISRTKAKKILDSKTVILEEYKDYQEEWILEI